MTSWTDPSCTYQLEFCFSTTCHSDRLDTLLPGLFIIETKERLLRLHAFSTIRIDSLEGDFQCVCWRKSDWFGGFVRQGDTRAAFRSGECKADGWLHTVLNEVGNRWKK